MNKKLKAKIYEEFGSQADFAVAMQVDESTISRVINGRRKLSAEDVGLWCRVLRCRPEIFEEVS